ncbi:MAG: hypothetical protein E7254_06785 [Lachnospiraceae bacterium]|nr:hypothetical protein [Lachnospiraceae bacterium]
MKGIIDIHNHILFSLDDGARTIDDSMKMIDEEYRQGVRKIIFTPHYWPGVYQNDLSRVKRKYDELIIKVKEKYSDMECYLGNEILYTEDVVDLVEKEKVYSMAGSEYLLVEFMPGIDYHVLETRLKKILISGYKPIVAHCERYKCLLNNIPRTKHLVDVGAYLQVNADSIYTFKYKGFVKKIIDNDCLHFIATDAHDLKNRSVTFEKCLKSLEKKYSDEYISWLLIENPQKVIDNQLI